MTPDERCERMYRAEAGRVLQYASYRVGRSAAEDVVAETFTVVWRRLDDVPEPPRAWLLGVARRVIANALRRGDHVETAGADALDSLADAGAQFADDVDRRSDLIRAMRLLPLLDREVLLLATWCDLSTADAARVMRCTQTTFGVRLHRARRRLGHALRDLEPTAPGDTSDDSDQTATRSTGRHAVLTTPAGGPPALEPSPTVKEPR